MLAWWCQISFMDGAAEYLKKHGKKKKERLVQKLPVEMEHSRDKEEEEEGTLTHKAESKAAFSKPKRAQHSAATKCTGQSTCRQKGCGLTGGGQKRCGACGAASASRLTLTALRPLRWETPSPSRASAGPATPRRCRRTADRSSSRAFSRRSRSSWTSALRPSARASEGGGARATGRPRRRLRRRWGARPCASCCRAGRACTCASRCCRRTAAAARRRSTRRCLRLRTPACRCATCCARAAQATSTGARWRTSRTRRSAREGPTRWSPCCRARDASRCCRWTRACPARCSRSCSASPSTRAAPSTLRWPLRCAEPSLTRLRRAARCWRRPDQPQLKLCRFNSRGTIQKKIKKDESAAAPLFGRSVHCAVGAHSGGVRFVFVACCCDKEGRRDFLGAAASLWPRTALGRFFFGRRGGRTAVAARGSRRLSHRAQGKHSGRAGCSSAAASGARRGPCKSGRARSRLARAQKAP